MSPIHMWFGLTYSAYLVLPRLGLENMPEEWQNKLVSLLEEAKDMGLNTPKYEVHRKDRKGRFITDPWADYRHGDFEEVNGSPLKVVEK